jgi:hypothetical protein
VNARTKKGDVRHVEELVDQRHNVERPWQRHPTTPEISARLWLPRFDRDTAGSHATLRKVPRMRHDRIAATPRSRIFGQSKTRVDDR